jgi:hypothetical protein
MLIVKAIQKRPLKSLVISLGACVVLFIVGVLIMPTSEDAEEEIPSEVVSSESEEEPQIETEEDKEEKAEKKLFDDIFVELSDQVGLMTYNECLDYFEGTTLTYDTTAPSDDDMGQISIEGDDGFKLVIDFYPNDDEEETITLLSYSNGDYEGSVSDSYHMDDVKYGIYDVTAEERNIDVDSLQDVITFIKDEVPLKQEAYENSVSENTELEVTLEPSYEISEGQVYFTVNTNLPDNTVLMLTLSDGADYTGQTKITIENGVATSAGFSKSGEQLSGHFTLDISMSLPKSQDESVIAVIGTKGEFLSGKYVESSSISGDNVVSGTFEFDF